MEKKEYLYKILVIGDQATGKSSIVRRYVHNFFTDRYKATFGVDFAMKVLNWEENTVIRLQLWDIAGQDRSRHLNRVFYNEASGCITVYDILRPSTLESVAKWKEEIDAKVQLSNGKPIPCVLFANKGDLLEKEGEENQDDAIKFDESIMEEYCKKHGFVDWFLTSAKENTNLATGTKRLVEKILENQLPIVAASDEKEERIELNSKKNPKQGKVENTKCC